MDADRVEFVFETDVAPVDIEDETEMIEWFEERLGPDPQGSARSALHTVVANQILGDNPPAAWATAQRLRDGGLDRDAIFGQMATVVGTHLLTMLDAAETTPASKPDPDSAAETIAAQYAALPWPEPDTIRAMLTEVVAESGVAKTDDVVESVAARLGGVELAATIRSLVDGTVDDLMSTDAFTYSHLEYMVHVPTVCAAITLTHVITEAELELGVLSCIGTDLAGFGHIQEPRLADATPLDRFSADIDHVGWSGPEGWLDAFGPGDVLAVGADGDTITIEVIEPPAPRADLSTLLGDCYAIETSESLMPLSFGELLISVLVEDRGAFAQPAPPLQHLVVEAGLEVRGGLVADGEQAWAELGASHRFNRVRSQTDDPEVALNALTTLDAIENPEATAEDLIAALEAMEEPALCELVLAELVDDDFEFGDPDTATAITERLMEAARRPLAQAVAHFAAAVVADRKGDVITARELCRRGIRVHDGWGPLVDHVAWYASDSGDAATAARLWGTLEGGEPGELAIVRKQAAAADDNKRRLGRNEPCWCGSGRKFKACHQQQAGLAPLPDRVPWLARKASSFLLRRTGASSETVMDLAFTRAAGTEPHDIAEALGDPIVIDVALTEEGWFEQFLERRGPLLPDDELMLAQSWLLVERSVYEVLDVDPGAILSVRDLRTGDVIEIRERMMSRDVAVGARFCGRAVPDGETTQLVGGVFMVRPGTEQAVMELCDNADGFELCAYLADRDAPPTVVTREGEAMVACELSASVSSSRQAKSVLDDHYDYDSDAGHWTELHPIGHDEHIVRATLTLDNDRLEVFTHSEERMDRVIGAIEAGIDGLTIHTDERRPLEPGEMPAMPSTHESPELDAETVTEVMDLMEQRWVSEPVPALDDLTPTEAAADPTRRDQVRRLIDSFPELADNAAIIGLRKDRLRDILGL